MNAHEIALQTAHNFYFWYTLAGIVITSFVTLIAASAKS